MLTKKKADIKIKLKIKNTFIGFKPCDYDIKQINY